MQTVNKVGPRSYSSDHSRKGSTAEAGKGSSSHLTDLHPQIRALCVSGTGNKICNSAEHLHDRCQGYRCCPGHNPYLSLSLREDRQLDYRSRQPLWEKQIIDLTERSCLVHRKAEVQNAVKQEKLRWWHRLCSLLVSHSSYCYSHRNTHPV